MMNSEIYNTLVEEAKRQRIYRYVVAAVVSRGSRVLLLKRPKIEFMGGIYELPSGMVEEGESLDAALSRELFEETGLELDEIKRYLGHFDYLARGGRMTRQFNFEVSVREGDLRLSEHESYAWIDKKEMNSYPITDSVKTILQQARGTL